MTTAAGAQEDLGAFALESMRIGYTTLGHSQLNAGHGGKKQPHLLLITSTMPTFLEAFRHPFSLSLFNKGI
jgi:hypothetical protein